MSPGTSTPYDADLASQSNLLLGFDPGRQKCGLAVMSVEHLLHCHQVVLSDQVISTINQWLTTYPISLVVMGNQTTAAEWQQTLRDSLDQSLPIVQVDERYSSLEARDRYWKMYPPQGLTQWIPRGMRTPERPIDDIVAILLIERYLQRSSEG
ncbi:MAG: Holliday junction resolvase RuvX [Acaryochloridaceae cyanobacterium CSU_5_19]|nr:Holliday junction resolvase RuvX [Acaryochloridaceae cyanobacterium CSU_5_19]